MSPDHIQTARKLEQGDRVRMNHKTAPVLRDLAMLGFPVEQDGSDQCYIPATRQPRAAQLIARLLDDA